MLVISNNAQEEANRLGKQSFPIRPLKLTPDIIHQVSSIDGAVLLDSNGICYAIGVILDGIATDKGDSARGARYNSAIRYYEYRGKQNPTVIVIISEDGMINLIPNLHPQIKHSLITNSIKALEQLTIPKTLKWKEFQQLMDFFEKVNFYLTQEECSIINKYRVVVENKDREDDSQIIKILRKDLTPNAEMNSSYYLEE